MDGIFLRLTDVEIPAQTEGKLGTPTPIFPTEMNRQTRGSVMHAQSIMD